jgi:hypothetical protein
MVINQLFDNLQLCLTNDYYSKRLITLKYIYIDVDDLTGTPNLKF